LSPQRCSRPLCSSQDTGGPAKTSACRYDRQFGGPHSPEGAPEALIPQDPTVCQDRELPVAHVPRRPPCYPRGAVLASQPVTPGPSSRRSTSEHHRAEALRSDRWCWTPTPAGAGQASMCSLERR